MSRIKKYGLFKLITNLLLSAVGLCFWLFLRAAIDGDGLFDNVGQGEGGDVALAVLLSIALFGIAVLMIMAIFLTVTCAVEALFGLLTLVTGWRGMIVPCLLIDLLLGSLSLVIMISTVQGALYGQYAPFLVSAAVVICLVVSVIFDFIMIAKGDSRGQKESAI